MKYFTSPAISNVLKVTAVIVYISCLHQASYLPVTRFYNPSVFILNREIGTDVVIGLGRDYLREAGSVE